MDNANDLKEALDFISPANLTYEEWVTVGMGLKEAGFPVTAWEQWSSRDGSRYHKGECARKWESFRGNPKPITENSIFALARNHGWPGPAGHELDWNDAICAPGTRPDGVVVDTRWLDVQELNIPEQWDPADQLRRDLQALFEPEDHVAYVTESYLRDDRYAPTKGCWDRTAGQLMDELARCGGDIGAVVGDYNPAAGAWICFNPVEGGRSNNNVTDYRPDRTVHLPCRGCPRAWPLCLCAGQGALYQSGTGPRQLPAPLQRCIRSPAPAAPEPCQHRHLEPARCLRPHG